MDLFKAKWNRVKTFFSIHCVFGWSGIKLNQVKSWEIYFFSHGLDAPFCHSPSQNCRKVCLPMGAECALVLCATAFIGHCSSINYCFRWFEAGSWTDLRMFFMVVSVWRMWFFNLWTRSPSSVWWNKISKCGTRSHRYLKPVITGRVTHQLEMFRIVMHFWINIGNFLLFCN